MRGLVSSFHSLYEEFRSDVEFLCVYIAEAHAQDEWPISSSRYAVQKKKGLPIIINQPKTNEERLESANLFVTDFEFRIPTVIDSIDNVFDVHYSPWPLRFYVIDGGKMAYIAQPKQCSYDLAHLRSWLLELLGKEDEVIQIDWKE